MAGLVVLRGRIALVAAGACVLLGGAGASSAPAGVVDVPVEFRVDNLNRSAVPCPSDGAGHRVRGHLVAPRRALLPEHRPAAVTVYLHGSWLGERTWRFTPGYDLALEMAKLGHASVTLSRLGFGESTVPHGFLACLGSEADVASQVVGQLRRGAYTLRAQEPGIDAPPAFERVALAGQSGGGAVARVEAYSFGGTDALVEIDTFRFSEASSATGAWWTAPAENTGIAPFIAPCATGGLSKEGGGVGGGYFLATFVRTFPEHFFHDAEPGIVEQWLAAGEREPCGSWASIPATVAQDEQRMGRITVPVLYIYGAQSPVWSDGAFARERQLLTGSPEVTGIAVQGASHMLMLERAAPDFRQKLSEWLAGRGF